MKTFTLSNIPIDTELDKFRKILKIPTVESLHHSYQYFHKRGKSVASNLGQDGIIEAIFDLIGTRNKEYVEVGGGNDYDNTYYLRTSKGWKGILLNAGFYIRG